MEDRAARTADNLRLGIEAARAGRNDTAQQYLTAVLKQDSNNIPALFWLAYVAPSAQESVRLLERVLTLDPNNERAKAGMQWAKKRLAAEAVQPEPQSPPSAAPPEETKPTPVPSEPEVTAQPESEPAELPDGFIRQQLLSQKDIQKRAKKGALAHRARRNIDPLLMITIILTGVAILLLMGIGILAFTPAETLAAWLPVPTADALVSTGVIDAVPEPVSVVSETQVVETQNAASGPQGISAGDVIIFNTPAASEPDVSTVPAESASTDAATTTETTALIEAGDGPTSTTQEPAELIDPVLESTEAAPATDTTEPALPVEEDIESDSAVSPEENVAVSDSISDLIGPAEAILNGPRLFVPVDEAQLAHQPAFEGEKWIEIDVTLQHITAWEGNVPIMSFIGSTGLPGTPTVLGEYNIYWKLEKTLMAGADYYLPDVPYTMYFYGSYALHGTYWHDNFGQPMSHGCVNLTNDNAQQIFEWADPPLPPGQTQVTSTYENPGTLVVVHE